MKWRMLVLALAIIFLLGIGAVIVVNALPGANSTPYHYSTFSYFWTGPTATGRIDENISVSGWYEAADIVYLKDSITVKGIYVKLGSNYAASTYSINAFNASPGFYIIYYAKYRTDQGYLYVAVYDESGHKLGEYTAGGQSTAPVTNQFVLSLSDSASAGSYYSNQWVGPRFAKQLEERQSYTFSPLFKALSYLRGENTAIIYINSTTSPVNVKITKENNTIYEQGFTENTNTYVFIMQDKLPVQLIAQGPAGSKNVTISAAGMWIVRLTPDLTDINYKGSSNFTVSVVVKDPDTNGSVVADYIRVYNVSNGEVVAEAQNVAEAAFTLPGGDYRFVATKGSSTASVEKSISGNDTVTIWLTPAASSGGSWLYVVAKCPAGQSITAQATLSNSSWSSVKATPANFTVSPGTYTLKIEAEGYETFQTNVDVNGPMVYTATLVPSSGGNGGSNSTWPWEGWNFTNPLDNVKKWLEDKWRQINDPIGYWLDQHGLGWLRKWWWLVALAALGLIVYLAKED